MCAFRKHVLNPDDENVLDVSGPIKEIRKKRSKKSMYCTFGSYVKVDNKIFKDFLATKIWQHLSIKEGGQIV